MFNFVAEWHYKRETMRDLHRLSDHTLADLGIARGEIEAVVAAALASPRGEPSISRPAVAASRAVDAADTMAPSWASHNRRSLAA